MFRWSTRITINSRLQDNYLQKRHYKKTSTKCVSTWPGLERHSNRGWFFEKMVDTQRSYVYRVYLNQQEKTVYTYQLLVYSARAAEMAQTPTKSLERRGWQRRLWFHSHLESSLAFVDMFRGIYFLSFFCFPLHCYFLSFGFYFFFSLSMYLDCWRAYVVPVVASTMACHCLAYSLYCITM